ncbi:MAG: Spore coat protein SA [candidate division WS2 bacterium]|nr:Spore coat protein SA [Candidatus Psychracetigena formicireducens]
MNQIKAVHIYDESDRVFPGGGSVSYIVYNIAKYTAARGCDVTILERRWKGLDYREVIEGIKFERIDLHFCSAISRKEQPRKLIKSPVGLLRFILDRTEFAFKVLRYLKKNNFDVVLVYFPFAAIILVTLNRKLRKKMIYREMIGAIKSRLKLDPAKNIPLLFKFFSPDLYLMKRVRKVVMLTESVQSELVSTGKIKREKLMVISLGVDTSEFTPDIDVGNIREKYKLNDKTIVLFASDIIPRKGVEHLVRAANIVVNQLNYKDVLFLLKGKFSEKEYLKIIHKLIEQYKLKESLKVILGYVPWEDVKKLYVASDVYVLPSLEDSIPTSLLEPLSCGKPLVGTSIGGIIPIIKDGWNGFLVEPGNEKQLAEKIRYLIDNEEERIRMGRNSRKLAEEEFDWSKIAEKYLEVYEEVKG